MDREINIKTSKGDAMFLRNILQQIITNEVCQGFLADDEYTFLIAYQKQIDAAILEDDRKLLADKSVISERSGIASEGRKR